MADKAKPRVNGIFDHYPAFMFAVLPDGTHDLWIASAHTAQEMIREGDTETLGAKITREHMGACRASWRRREKIDVKVVLLTRDEVEFIRH